MGKTKRYEPRNGEFKRLRGNNKQRNKRDRKKNKANLQKHIKFASDHRAAIDMCQSSAAMYMKDDK